MSRLFFFLGLFLFPFLASAQGDMLLLKKKGKVIKTYFPGSVIYVNVGDGFQEFYINKLENDTLFLFQYQIRDYMTNLGLPKKDTTGTIGYVFHYNEILSLYQPKTSGWDWRVSGASLFGGGVLLTAAGLLTWVFSEKNSRYYARPEFVGASAALAGIGYLLLQAHSGNKWTIGHKYTLQYISTK